MKTLRPIEIIYHFLVGTKNILYDQKILQPIKLKIPVVSVGNLSFGGVGKTPFIILLAQELSTEFKINIITRSYKASLREPSQVNLQIAGAPARYGDEACLLQLKLPNCSVWSGPNKASTAAASVVSRPDLILLDDGFSHRKLARNFDLLLIDATQGLNHYSRETLRNIKRTHAVLITKANLSDEQTIHLIEKQIMQLAPQLSTSIYTSEVITELAFDKGQPLFVFCGLGRPETFIHDLTRQGYDVVDYKFYADHFHYTADEEINILKKYRTLKEKHKTLKIVTTEKDLVKLNNEELKNILAVPTHQIKMHPDQKEALLEKIRQSF